MNDITQTPPQTTRRAFIVRVNPGSQVALDRNVIGIGWSNLRNMDPKWTWGELKKQIKQAYPKYEGRGLGNVAGSIERFCLESGGMRIGDYVLMPVGRGFHLGIVKSEVKRCDDDLGREAHLQWQRDVEWLTKDTKGIPRDVAQKALQNRLKIRQTCADVTDLLVAIREAEENRTKEPFGSKAKSAARDVVAEVVKTHIGNDQLEKLIAQLCKGLGAINVKVLSKNNPKKGDADVQADYPVMVGHTTYFVRVFYQTKNHDGKTGVTGINQLRDRIKDENDNGKDSEILAYKGCLVTTAGAVSDKAKEQAEDDSNSELEIDILTLDDLADWILDAGLSNLNV